MFTRTQEENVKISHGTRKQVVRNSSYPKADNFEDRSSVALNARVPVSLRSLA